MSISFCFILILSLGSQANELTLNDVSTTKEFKPDKNYQMNSYYIKLDQEGEAQPLKVITYNIAQTGVNDQFRDVIVAENADIVLMQETGDWESTENEDLISDLDYINSRISSGPYTYFEVTRELSNTGGQAIFSRYEITSFTQLEEFELDNGDIEDLSHDPLYATVVIHNVEVHLYSFHFGCCANGRDLRDRTMEALMNHADTIGDVPIIFAGDLNTVSRQDAGFNIDINLGFNTIDMLLNESHPRGSKVHQWLDVFRTLNPGDPGASMESFFNSRIDYIFVNEFFFDKLVNSTVTENELTKVGSDHYPVSGTFNFNPSVDITPPIQVQGVDATKIDDSSVEFSWDLNSETDLSYYSTFLDETHLDDVNNETNSFTETGLQSDNLYNFQVSATDLIGNIGVKSYPLYYDLTYGVHTSPRAPILTASITTDGILLNWEISDNGGFEIDDFAVLRATQDSIIQNSFRVMEYVETTTYLDDSVREGRTYYYKVFGRNLLGNGLDSNLVEVIVESENRESTDDSLTLGLFPILVAPFFIKKIRQNFNL